MFANIHSIKRANILYWLNHQLFYGYLLISYYVLNTNKAIFHVIFMFNKLTFNEQPMNLSVHFMFTTCSAHKIGIEHTILT